MAITLKAARVNRGLTQKQAAEKLNVSEDTIANWEKGRSFPDYPKIEMIVELYGIPYNDLIFLPRSTDKP